MIMTFVRDVGLILVVTGAVIYIADRVSAWFDGRC
jgi:hypothetical protein